MKKDFDTIVKAVDEMAKETLKALTEATNKATDIMTEMAVPRGSTVFVTIGIPCSDFPIMQKAMIYIDPFTDTPITAAKKFRKHVADNIEYHGWEKGVNFTPAVLYYEIYGSVTNEIPFAVSSNSPKATGEIRISTDARWRTNITPPTENWEGEWKRTY